LRALVQAACLLSQLIPAKTTAGLTGQFERVGLGFWCGQAEDETEVGEIIGHLVSFLWILMGCWLRRFPGREGVAVCHFSLVML
jgi:hypothetical protein